MKKLKSLFISVFVIAFTIVFLRFLLFVVGGKESPVFEPLLFTMAYLTVVITMGELAKEIEESSKIGRNIKCIGWATIIPTYLIVYFFLEKYEGSGMIMGAIESVVEVLNDYFTFAAFAFFILISLINPIKKIKN